MIRSYLAFFIFIKNNIEQKGSVEKNTSLSSYFKVQSDVVIRNVADFFSCVLNVSANS